MKWLSNLYNPRLADAKMFVSTMSHEAQNEAWQRQENWLKDKIIGRPQGTQKYSVEQLEQMGYIGVYSNLILEGKEAKEFIAHILDGE